MVHWIHCSFFGVGMKNAVVKLLLAGALTVGFAAAGANDFPYRKRYPDAPTLETTQLQQRLGKVVVVDVRSAYEYETLRIKGAVNIPLTDRDFVARLKAVREKSNDPIVFYCNGVTCHKSYDATLLAKNNRVSEVYAYDAGIFEWAKTYPAHTELLGKSPAKAADLIDDENFKSRLLTPADFSAKAAANGALVLDVRDRYQRDNPLFPLREQRVQLDEKARLAAIIEQAKKENKTLLVYDAAGKQVQWLQYELHAKGLKDYYFMQGGAEAFWQHRFGKVVAQKPEPAKATP